MQDKILVPPLKIQGIKTKLVPLIKENVDIDEDTLWIEPFMGSGVVGFNIAPRNAVFADTNPHIIDFYNAIKNNEINSYSARAFLEKEGRILQEKDSAHYLFVRDRFNDSHSPFDFLFLNRACFNGMMRFNRYGKFNVPYGHKPERFSKAYVTKICNQIKHVELLIKNNNWDFVCQSFDKTISLADGNSFVYCDPPYIGRNVDYYDSWDETLERSLCKSLHDSNSKFMISTWDHNQYRSNSYLDILWSDCNKITKEHFYHIGAKEANRNPMVEALLTNFTPIPTATHTFIRTNQLQLCFG